MPTLLEAAGAPVLDGVEGVSLLPLARGGTEGLGRAWIHMEHCPSAVGPWQALTDGREKYAWQTLDGTEWLFDLERDPQELHNLAGEPAAADRLALWRERLAKELARYEPDGLVKDGRLRPGRAVPVHCPWLEAPARRGAPPEA